MLKRYIAGTSLVATLFLLTAFSFASDIKANTASSLAMKKDKVQMASVQSPSGDLYKQLLHHGPAVENRWAAYRIYFNKHLSVDILSKFQPRLELAEGKWYGGKKPEFTKRNFGKDNYKVGKTVGLGGIRLWDATKDANGAKSDKGQVTRLDVASKGKREGHVQTANGSSSINIRNVNVPYQDTLVNIDMTLTVFDDKRHAQIELLVHGEQAVQFVTGVTIHNKLLEIKQGDNYLATWGDYDSPAAAEAFNLGAGLVFNPDDIERSIKEDDQLLVVTKPLKRFTYLISTSNEKEHSELNTFDSFHQYIKELP